MNVGDFFTNLSYGELAQHTTGMSGAGMVKPEEQSRIINFMNQGLTRIYTRRAHNIHYVNIMLLEGITTYTLDPQYLVDPNSSGPTNSVPYTYIMYDETDVFDGNLIKLHAINAIDEYGTVGKTDLLTNGENFDFSIKQVKKDTLMVTNPVDQQLLQISYQKNHAPLSVSPPDHNEEILLAPILEEALMAYVGSKVFGAMSGEAHIARSQILRAEYERLLSIVEEEDLIQTLTDDSCVKFTDRGFV